MINNNVRVTGRIDGFAYDHTAYGEKFYASHVHIRRLSETVDDIPVIASEYLVKKDDFDGKYVEIDGEFRSMNMDVEGKSKLILQIFAKNIRTTQEKLDDENKIVLNGFVVKKPVYRITPSGREITNMLIAVNRPRWRSDYIPCVCWGRSAKWAEDLTVGTAIFIEGRIQSRTYVKKLSDEEREVRTAYEVSIGKMEVNDDEKKD